MYALDMKLLLCVAVVALIRLAKTQDDLETLTKRYPKYLPKEFPTVIRQAAHYYSMEERMQENICFEENMMITAQRYLTQEKDDMTECKNALRTLFTDRLNREKYAIRMTDSWGRKESGLRTGNHVWLGRYFECKGESTEDFKGKWCKVSVGFVEAEWHYIQLGTCFPDVCSEKEISEIYPVLPSMNAVVSCPTDLSTYTALDIVALVICSILGALVITGSVYELVLSMKQKQQTEGNELNVNSVADSKDSLPIPSRLILSFSIINNTKVLLDTTQKEGNINVLHGMRFISMSWVILGHAFAFCLNYVDNSVDMSEYYLNHGEFQAVGNATFSVDTFFFLSGLLVAYLGLRELDKRGTINVPLMYLNRYLRLTPTLALVMLVTVSIYGKFGDGPDWSATFEATKHPCDLYWWTNLLYINNMYPSDLNNECIGWVWYLANDMQFYLLSPLFLFLLHFKPKAGVAALGFFILASATSTGVVSSVYDLMPDAINVAIWTRFLLNLGGGIPVSEYSLEYSGDVNETTGTPAPADDEGGFLWMDIYAKPWCRLGAYLIGMSTGYFLHVTRRGIKMNKVFVVIMWIVVTAVELAVVYGFVGPILGDYKPTVDVAAFYNAVSRPLWAAGLAWVTIACINGYGSPINEFLSWKAFMPLSRLTYCAYLIHPLVLMYAYTNRELRPHFTVANTVSVYLASLLLSYGLSYVVSMCIEAPMSGIQRVIFPRSKSAPKTAPVVIANHTNGDVEMAEEGFENKRDSQTLKQAQKQMDDAAGNAKGNKI